MNRREFLGYIGAALLAAVGISGMLKAVMNHDAAKTLTVKHVDGGYGGSVYGGSATHGLPRR